MRAAALWNWDSAAPAVLACKCKRLDTMRRLFLMRDRPPLASDPFVGPSVQALALLFRAPAVREDLATIPAPRIVAFPSQGGPLLYPQKGATRVPHFGATSLLDRLLVRVPGASMSNSAPNVRMSEIPPTTRIFHPRGQSAAFASHL